jgi:hypothetical protein
MQSWLSAVSPEVRLVLGRFFDCEFDEHETIHCQTQIMDAIIHRRDCHM